MILLHLTLAAVLALGGFFPPAASTSAVAVFVVAHQDDELLTFGASVRSHAEAGVRTVVVVATDGSATRARGTIADRLGRDVTPAEMTIHRDAEFAWTCRALGADECVTPPAGVRIVDGQSTPESTREVLGWVLQRWPGARVKTHSPLAYQLDHRLLGETAAQMHREGQITDLRHYLARYEITAARERGETVPSYGTTRRQVGDTEQDAYRLWAPDKGFNRYWSVGYISAGPSFRAHRADPVSHYHAPLEDR